MRLYGDGRRSIRYPRSSTLLSYCQSATRTGRTDRFYFNTSKMSILSDTARLSSNPEHDMMLQDPHPDLLESSPSSSEAKPARMTGGGMRAAMTAGYDPSTKLATGTTMAEYKRINMRATTIGMWGGIVAGGLVSEYIRSDLAVSLLIVAMALKRRTSLSKNALTFSFLCESTTSTTLSHLHS